MSDFANVLEAIKAFVKDEIVLFGIRWLILLTLSGIGVMLGLFMFGRNYKKRIAKLEAKVNDQTPVTVNVNQGSETAGKTPEPMPEHATFEREFQIAYWTDPKDGERKQVWIPVIWLQYENGARKHMEIEDLLDKQNMTLFPLGPVSFSENADNN